VSIARANALNSAGSIAAATSTSRAGRAPEKALALLMASMQQQPAPGVEMER
jgi:hypothetical protein